MTDKPRQQMRELIAVKLCDKATYCNECAMQADAVMELFPDVQHVPCLPAHAKAGEPWTRFVLRTEPQPVEETQP